MKPEDRSKKQSPSGGAGVYPGDEVFFHHKSGPKSGRVLAHGRHGCTVECDGEHHKVKWDRVLGHKKRADQTLQVVDQGDAGMIVEDHRGRRRFVGLGAPEKQERMVMKSHSVARLIRSV